VENARSHDGGHIVSGIGCDENKHNREGEKEHQSDEHSSKHG